jgi:outer membrane protein TolC
VSYAQSKVRHERLAAEVTADREAVAIATRLYKQGLNDFLSVLDAERSLYAADDKLAQSERDTALERVALYKALGGDWLAANDDAKAGIWNDVLPEFRPHRSPWSASPLQVV